MAKPGDNLGPFILEGALARGGMGAVYRARNRITGQPRALKVIRADLADDADFIDRFVREASIASELRHPNLVETFEPGIDGDTIYLPMELLEGQTLAQRIAERGRMSPAEAAPIVVAIAGAVQMLHDRGLMHRDLKPANVFLARTEAGEVPKVIDLGAARRVEDDEHTRTGLVIGSPFYMALEQAEGRRDIDGRADQYALGVIAYQLLTGARPYETDESTSAIAKLLRGDRYPRPGALVPGGLSPELEGVIIRALARVRTARFPSIAALGEAFAAAAQPYAEVAPDGRAPGAARVVDTGPTAIVDIVPQPPRLRRRTIGLAAAALAAATTLVAMITVTAVWVVSAADGVTSPGAMSAAAAPPSLSPSPRPDRVPDIEAVAPVAVEVAIAPEEEEPAEPPEEHAAEEAAPDPRPAPTPPAPRAEAPARAVQAPAKGPTPPVRRRREVIPAVPRLSPHPRCGHEVGIPCF